MSYCSLLRRHLTEESGGGKKFVTLSQKYFFSKRIRRLEPIERPAEEASRTVQYCSSNRDVKLFTLFSRLVTTPTIKTFEVRVFYFTIST